MKKLVTFFITIIYICFSVLPCFAQNDGEIAEKSETYNPRSKYMLMADIESDLFMYEKNSEESISPSGFAKILTAITAIENAENLNKKITVPEKVLDGFDYSNRNIGLKYGEKISLYDLIQAMIVFDASDCAIVIAHSVGESYDKFIEMMNQTAKKAGAKKSVFMHPAGFNKTGQSTSLNDLYYITKYALENETFAKIASLDHIKIAPTNEHDQRVLFSTNQFLTTYYSPDHYNGDVYGVKSYHNSAEDCGIIARYDNSKINVLILCAKAPTENGNSYCYNDAKHLINMAKEDFVQVNLLDKEEFMAEVNVPNGKNATRLLLVNEKSVQTMLPKNYDKSLIKIETENPGEILAPIQKGQVIGKANILYNGKKYTSVNLLAFSDVEKSTINHIKNAISNITSSWIFKLILTLVILIFVLAVVNKIQKNIRKQKR